MTEEEWPPDEILEWESQCGPRRRRLFVIGCCRSLWSWLSDGRSRAAIEVAERFADGHVSNQELITARTEAETAAEKGDGAAGAVIWAASSDEDLADPNFNPTGQIIDILGSQEGAIQKRLWFDVFGPMQAVFVDPVWLTPKVVKLAQMIYDERRFEDLPILADALEEAGCTSSEILEHCRGPGPHVRGCWVVDALTGKE